MSISIDKSHLMDLKPSMLIEVNIQLFTCFKLNALNLPVKKSYQCQFSFVKWFHQLTKQILFSASHLLFIWSTELEDLTSLCDRFLTRSKIDLGDILVRTCGAATQSPGPQYLKSALFCLQISRWQAHIRRLYRHILALKIEWNTISRWLAALGRFHDTQSFRH